MQSLLPILGLIFAFGEHSVVLQQPALHDPVFLVVSLLGGLIGFAISFSSLWFLSQVGGRGLALSLCERGRGDERGVGRQVDQLLQQPQLLPSARWEDEEGDREERHRGGRGAC